VDTSFRNVVKGLLVPGRLFSLGCGSFPLSRARSWRLLVSAPLPFPHPQPFFVSFYLPVPRRRHRRPLPPFHPFLLDRAGVTHLGFPPDPPVHLPRIPQKGTYCAHRIQQTGQVLFPLVPFHAALVTYRLWLTSATTPSARSWTPRGF